MEGNTLTCVDRLGQSQRSWRRRLALAARTSSTRRRRAQRAHGSSAHSYSRRRASTTQGRDSVLGFWCWCFLVLISKRNVNKKRQSMLIEIIQLVFPSLLSIGGSTHGSHFFDRWSARCAFFRGVRLSFKRAQRAGRRTKQSLLSDSLKERAQVATSRTGTSF